MEIVITVLDNGKLLKPQTLEDGELTPFFKIKKTEIQGKCKLEEESEDFTNLARKIPPFRVDYELPTNCKPF